MAKSKITLKKRLLLLPLTLLLILPFSQDVNAASQRQYFSEVREVYVGGIPFGIKLYSEGLTVVGFSDVDCESGSTSPAQDAGIKVGDTITDIGGEKTTTSEEFAKAIDASPNGIEITYTREGKSYDTVVVPSKSKADGKYKTGMWLRDSTSGIGTVTFFDKESGYFAGLGHGVCTADTGELVKLTKGEVIGVKISGVKAGTPGDPGELKGVFTGKVSGEILKNTVCGVIGRYDSIPDYFSSCESIELGNRNDVKCGAAEILCTIGSEGVKRYSIEINSIPEGKKKSNFEISVTDSELIEKTSGIVQGMSGSPILQNGKLVGAVTHVLVNDSARGYGIFIEDMVEASG